MNPILRAAANGLNRSRSEGQIRLEKQKALQKQKRKQEKEKRRVDALEREEKWMASGKSASKKEEGGGHEESAAEKFQKELCWCIQQLEMGLANMKPNARQVQEAEKVLRTLKSPKAPIAKKRQVMRSTFGDYRNKMLQEEKKHAAAMSSKTNISTVPPKKVNQATFYRRAAGPEFHHRSISWPEGYVPSLTPTEEEVTLANLAEAFKPAESTSSEMGEASDTTGISKHSSEDITSTLDLKGGLALTTEGSGNKSRATNTIIDNQSGNNKLNSGNNEGDCSKRLAGTSDEGSTAQKASSIVDSDLYDPRASSQEHSPLVGQGFRFDFQIDEDGEVVELKDSADKGMNDLEKSSLYSDGRDNKEQETVPSADNGGGNSPVIEGLQGKEGKKKRRNRKKKKAKEAECLGIVQETGKADDNKALELSVGGGEFKFNFDTEKE